MDCARSFPRHLICKQRIEELTSRHAAVQNVIARLKARRPSGVRPEGILEMLDGIPDLRAALASADPAELADICDASKSPPSTTRPTGPSNYPRRSPPSCSQKTKPRPMRTTRSGDSYIAGAVSKRVPATTKSPADTGQRIPSALAYRIEEGLESRCRSSRNRATQGPPTVTREPLWSAGRTLDCGDECGQGCYCFVDALGCEAVLSS